jgi:hypothetical protein
MADGEVESEGDSREVSLGGNRAHGGGLRSATGSVAPVHMDVERPSRGYAHPEECR